MTRISLPMTLLLAVTTFFARMSGNNEVTALKSLGVPPWVFLWPVMVLGLLVSLAAVWINEKAVTWAIPSINTVIFRAAEDIILKELKGKHSYVPPQKDFTIMVKGVENRRLILPTITTTKPAATIEADFAELNIDFNAQELNISLTNPKVRAEGGTEYWGNVRTLSVPLPKAINDTSAITRPANMGFQMLADETSKAEADRAQNHRQIAAQRTFASSMGAVDQWLTPEVVQLKLTTANHDRRIMRLSAEPPRRWATGFACICFIWMGAPLAIWMKKADIFSSFFACFIPVLLFYYPLLMFGMQGAKKGTLPPDAVWIANICTGIVGIWLLRKIHRY